MKKTEKNLKRLNYLILFLSIFFSFLIIEIILSFLSSTNKEIISRKIRLREWQPSINRYFTPDNKYIENSENLIQKGYKFKVSEEGYIYPSKIYKQPDKTLLFLGGSTTECMYVEEENRFPYLVGKIIDSSGVKINSFNSGKSGNNSMHSINIFLNKGLELKPDFAIMMHNINDLNILLYEKSYWNSNPSRSLIISERVVPKYQYVNIKNMIQRVVPKTYKLLWDFKEKVLKNSHEYDEFAHLRGEKIEFNSKIILKNFSQNLVAFINIAKAYDVTPILMTQANRITPSPDKKIIESWRTEKDFGIKYEDYQGLYEEMNQIILKVGESNNVMVIDLANNVPKTSQYMYDAIHFNDFGSRYVSKLISKKIKKILYD